ncbi:PAS domain S-box protein [Sphingomonas sp. Leaf412]|uniref:PAS domain S-box protein n=1 Tax=Sphingomonas sp. Leaf412 TaxID=1736370 RepID=UPI0009EAC467|nr:PAS domain S-box protein [Sphingomonas sp. Leaf412]
MLDDAAAINRLGTIDKILEAACRLTGMRFAAVARVTADRWLACAVQDAIAFGLRPGDELDVESTLCREVGARGRTIAIDHVALDPVYRDHHTPQRYGFQSYISTPILRRGAFFGTLCALDPAPARPSDPAIRATFELFAELIGRHLETEASLRRGAGLVELADRFRILDDPADISFAAAEVLGRILDVDRSGYADVDDIAETARIERDWTAPGVASVAGVHRFRRFGTFVDDLKRGEPVVIVDADLDPRTAATAGAMTTIGARAIVNLPIIEHGRLVAILLLNCAAPREWLPEELAFIRDVADRTRFAVERRRAERELRHLTATLEARVIERTAERDRMWDTSPDLMLVIDFDGVFRRVNPAWTVLLGYAQDELVGHHVNEFVVPDDHADTVDAYELAAAGGRPTMLNRYRHKDGTIRWISWTAAPAGEMTYATGRDVTADRRQAVEVRRYREIVEATTSPICAFDADYRLIAFNRAHNDEFRRVNGFDTRVGDVFPDLFAGDQRGVMRALMTRALSGESFTVVEAFGRPELGTPRWEINYTPLRDEAGRIVGAFHQALDISERLLAEAELDRAQAALRQSQKLESMGQLTGGVAHDINNLLTPIMGSLDLLHRRGVGTDRERRMIDGALQSAERARLLVQRLLAFARRQPLQAVAVDVAALVVGMAHLIEATSGPRVRVDIDLAPDLPPAKADANQLELAILNLAVNARDAMAEGGVLTIGARFERVDDAQRRAVPAGDYIRLTVADDGSGMGEDTLARAIEPFFSTKGVGKGTGLGLSMVHGLAAQLGGGLAIASEPGKGTVIDLWLPASAEVAPVAAAAPEGEAARAAGTALLVDDEELVRLSTADMLADLGYTVLEAASAEEALVLVDGGTPFDVLVTDHLMPGMSGAELAREVAKRRPQTSVLVVSGYAELEGIAPDLPRLSKPYQRDGLAAALAEATTARHRA